MTHKHQVIAVSKLLLDQSNARLGELQPNQQATQIALAEIVGTQLLEIAEDIVAHGLDPTTIPAVTPDGAPAGKFRVIEGNRRLLALRALDTPAIVDSVFTAGGRKKLARLSEAFRKDPISSVLCVLFETEDEARRWIELRHTGANEGVGLVEWDSNEQDRYRARHGGPEERKPPGQIIDFVSKAYPPQPGDKKVFTTLDRVVSTRFVREQLGIEIEGGRTYSLFPGIEVMKGLSTLVLDLRSGRKKVTDLYYEGDRVAYVNSLGPHQLPDPATRLATRQPLTSLSLDSSAESSSASHHQNAPTTTQQNAGSTTEANSGAPSPTTTSNPTSPTSTSTRSGGANNGSPSTGTTPTRPSRAKPLKRRTTTVPSNCVLWIKDQPRINAIYHELVRLDVDQFTNACAVSLRVFIELTTDHHITLHNLIPENQRRNTALAQKLKTVADFLKNQGRIDDQLKRAIYKVADGSNMLSASTVTFNQYVHNPFAYPQPTELCTAWDEVQPFMQALWTK